MGHGKETPRQKMIGMMYLVLTAMLALNVSKEVLEAFVIVDHGLVQTTESFASKNSSIYNAMDLSFSQNAEKYGPWKEKTDEVKKLSNELYDFLNECKVEIVQVKGPEAIVDGKVDLDAVKVKDDNNTPAQIMLVEKKGDALQEKIEEYREEMKRLVGDDPAFEALRQSIEDNLNTDEYPPEKAGDPAIDWVAHNFEHWPLAGVITLLSGMQANVRNVENDVLGYLSQQADAKDFKVNVIKPVILPNSNVVFQGQEYRASVFLAGYDSTKIPEVVLNTGETLEVEDGAGIFSTTSSQIGEHPWGGVVKLDNDGELIEKNFTASYRVQPSSASISPTKMNVFYRGVANPVSITASGVQQNDIIARISAGKIEPTTPAGNYFVYPGPKETQSTVRVFANIDGRETPMGEMDFRVKNLPTPIAVVEGLPKGSGSLSLSQVTRLQKVEALAEDFLFEVDFTVTSFVVSSVFSGGVSAVKPSNSENFTAEQKAIFRQLKPGSRVDIEDIKAIGPDGVSRALSSISIKIR